MFRSKIVSMVRSLALPLSFIFIATLSISSPADAAGKFTFDQVSKAVSPAGTAATKPRLSYRVITLQGEQFGWLFETWRAPTLVLDQRSKRSRLSLGMFYNGLDDKNWPFRKILAPLLQKLCGVGGGAKNTGAAIALMNKGSGGKVISPDRKLAGNGGIFRHRRYVGKVGTCDSVVEIKGGRWHKIFVTLSPAE